MPCGNIERSDMVLQMQGRGRTAVADRKERVATGSVVTLPALNEAEAWEVTIVSTHEADPEADLISDQCPIGEALLGRRAGDIVAVAVPVGTVRYRVLSVEPPRRRGWIASQPHPAVPPAFY
jgi:transcription elongation GreA/GreB family factor